MFETFATPAAPVVAVYMDIDATIVVQMAVFWFVVLFVHYSLVRPYLKVVEEREEGIGGSRDDAREMEERAEDLEEEYDEKMRQARREAQEVRESLKNQGLQEKKDQVDEVREELDEKIASEREAIEQKVESAREDLEARADELAEAMVEQIVPDT